MERVVQHADDSRWSFVPRPLEPELLDELLLARAARDGSRTRVRNVGEQRAERDDEIDAEILCQAGDETGERPPTDVWLDAQE